MTQVHIQLLTTANIKRSSQSGATRFFASRQSSILTTESSTVFVSGVSLNWNIWLIQWRKTQQMRQIFPCFSVWHLWRSDCCRFGRRGKDDGNVVERRCYLALERKQNVCVLSWTPHNSHRQTETRAWTHKTCLTLKNGHKADLDLNTTCKCEISLVHGISQVSIAIPKWQKQDMKFSSDKNSWTLKNARTIFSTTKNMTKYELCASMAFYIWFTRLNCIS